MSLKSRARNASRVTLGACLVSLTLSTGCASMTQSESAAPKKSLLERMPWAKKDKAPEPYPNPAKLAAVWSTESLTQVGRVPTRGFGGRIFFYDEKTRSVPVDGTLVIHGFDDKAEDPKTAVKRFEFTPEQLTSHFSQSDVGASYSVWIPWDAIGGEQRHISLVHRSKPRKAKRCRDNRPTFCCQERKQTVRWHSPTAIHLTSGLGNKLRQARHRLAAV
ncbi:signal peptide protein [Rhodopirellula europaea 6C]|uniref:Signal peptide protein n=1 Tax=Rhodopirellula europaea 6C TaxID=1263867 RepID=M2A871_9BACT|nr:signal peptide protein [Rhodopirellula europaea 6C]